ncbi:MAG: hypothetical protein JWR52_2481 [Marmoricola sp.]|nr:hypothetical protein [Marmoricola sp.]
MTAATEHRSGLIASVLDEATGAQLREDPVLPRTGGPAGNALLTAWTGLVLLVLSVAELLTLFNVRGLITWHVVIGALLVPPAVLKTASTGWRMVRYYSGNAPYRQAGPPPTLLRLLGPVVVVSTLGLLATGTVLVLIGQLRSHDVLLTLAGFRISWITLHQGAFIVWGGATGAHLLGRIVPALRIALRHGARSTIPGRFTRLSMFALVLVTATVLAVVLARLDGGWHGHLFLDHHDRG